MTLCDSNRPYNFLLIPKLQLPLQPFLSRGTFAAPFIFSHSPAFHRTDFATHPARPRTDSPAFYRTNFARAPARQSDGLTFGIPSPAFPRTDFARIRKADANSTISQSRYGRNQPPLNHEPTIPRVESKNDSDSTIPHPRSFNSNRKTARQNCRALKSFTGEVQSDSGESAANAVEGAPEIGGFAVGVVKNYS